MPIMKRINPQTGQVEYREFPASQGPGPDPRIQPEVEGKVLGNSRTVVQTQGDALNNQNTARTIRQNPISPDDQKIIDRYRAQAAAAAKARQTLDSVTPIIDRFKPSPEKASKVKNATVTAEDGFFDRAGAAFNAWRDGVTSQDIADYAGIERGVAARVADIQQGQAGPQTESDAQRYRMTTINPANPYETNVAAIGEGLTQAMLDQEKPDFFTKWANRNGSLGALENGKSADQVWQEKETRRWNTYRSLMAKGKGGGGESRPPKNRTLNWDDM